jgi:uncharacterized protein (TIGR02246 family)
LQSREPREIVEEYREAFEAKDAARCAGFFAEDATLKFIFGTFKGRKAIEDWHQERFSAEVKLLRVETVSVEGDQVSLNAAVTSRKLRRFRMNEVKGTVVFHLRDGLFSEAHFSPRRGVASHLDWHFR